jgi:predicted nucleic acid-binding protein
MLRRQRAIGYLPPVVAYEVFHVAIRDALRHALPNHLSDLAKALPMRRRFDWNDLYKVKPELLDDLLPQLEQPRLLIEAEQVQFLQPDDVAPLPDGTLWETELLHLVGRYHLDTADAAILLDAQRAGITSIAKLDADLRRAQLDFDVYTWL